MEPSPPAKTREKLAPHQHPQLDPVTRAREITVLERAVRERHGSRARRLGRQEKPIGQNRWARSDRPATAPPGRPRKLVKARRLLDDDLDAAVLRLAHA